MIAAVLFIVACVAILIHSFLCRLAFGVVHLGWLGVAIFVSFFAIMAAAHPPGW